ncbi:sugar transferase [Nonomuraea sp. H19]|uniref:sugar transferase n=1 Tax=Nonomuraea sp. H19 TaxID=3452206 RepID=UPI003F8CA499
MRRFRESCRDAVKRTIDVLVALTALLLTAPLLLLTAVLVARWLGRPVLFRQARSGLGDRPFTLIKFRTMCDPDPARGLVCDADRLTSFGQKLRRSSLDELPNLWNVLKGDMSVVGPRPLPVRYLDLYTPEQARRHEVRPGLTGLAQVRGRNLLSWEQKLAYDVEYVQRRSIAMDLWIIFATVAVILRRDGVSAPDEATVPEFTGTEVTGRTQ